MRAFSTEKLPTDSGLLSIAAALPGGHFALQGGHVRHELTETERLSDVIVEADVMRLNQVLANLIVNALRYTPKGGSVTLSGEPTSFGVLLCYLQSAIQVRAFRPKICHSSSIASGAATPRAHTKTAQVGD
ncbi:MAG: hypothetical protein ACYDEO_26570 [Aggregatilineales bacterium]